MNAKYVQCVRIFVEFKMYLFCNDESQNSEMQLEFGFLKRYVAFSSFGLIFILSAYLGLIIKYGQKMNMLLPP